MREILDYLEAQRPKLKSLDSTTALNVVKAYDRAYLLFNQLDTANLSPEQGRFVAIQELYKKQAAKILRALGGGRALKQDRPSPSPDRDQWWWYLDELVAEQQRRVRQRITIVTAVILLIFGSVVILFRTILAPSPEAVARVEAENDSMAAIEIGDYESALVAIDDGLAKVPGDAGLLLVRGVIQELLGDGDAAQQSFAQAQAGVDDPGMYYLGRGQLYLRTNQFEKAENDARTALEIDDNLSAAWLLLGQSLESQNRQREALEVYQTASDVAFANGDNEVVVLARLALSRIVLPEQ